jgi:DNA-directed RNA polymerase subunit RPC12/RpoP
MKADIITCPLCGHHFDPAEHASCQSCPLNRDCGFVCCPECGYQIIYTARSKLANLATRWFNHKKKNRETKDTSS